MQAQGWKVMVLVSKRLQVMAFHGPATSQQAILAAAATVPYFTQYSIFIYSILYYNTTVKYSGGSKDLTLKEFQAFKIPSMDNCILIHDSEIPGVHKCQYGIEWKEKLKEKNSTLHNNLRLESPMLKFHQN